MMPAAQNAPAPAKARPVFLSVIIPAHNEAQRLPPAIAAILDFLHGQPYKSEVLVVENGSHDDTFALAQAMAREEPTLRVLQEKERGKGLAVRRGMLEANGDYRLFSDADLSVPVSEISRFLPPLLTDFDVAIASRELPGSLRIGEPAWRHFVGLGVQRDDPRDGPARLSGYAVRIQVLPRGGGAGHFSSATAFGDGVRRGSDLHRPSPRLPDQGSADALALRSGLARAAGEGFDRDGLRPAEDSHERPARII